MTEDVLVYRCESEEDAEQIALALTLFPAHMGVRCVIEDEVLIVFASAVMLEVIAATIESAADAAGNPVERLERIDDECDDDPQTCGWGVPVGEA